MLNHILVFVVVMGPTIFAVCVEVMSENVRKHPFWKYGVIFFGIVLSVLTWLQISIQDANARREQQAAIEEVASKTSERVTKVVSSQYQSVVTGLTNQIAVLKGQLASQSKDISTIKHSNIVTGSKPVPVDVMNLPPANKPQSGRPTNISWQQQAREPVNGKAAVLVTVRVDNSVIVPAFLATCDRPCETSQATVIGVSSASTLRSANDPTVAGFVFTQPRPLTPGIEVQWIIVSEDEKPVTISKVRLLSPLELPENLR